jgi:hypothetical protein
MKAGGYGYGGEVISPGNIVYGASNTSVPMNPDGTVNAQFSAADTATNAHVGGRRRKTKKGGKKSKKTKKGGKKSRKTRKMRGGVSVENIATAGTSFTGAVPGMPGSQTYGQYTGYSVGSPANNPHSAGADGVMRV